MRLILESLRYSFIYLIFICVFIYFGGGSGVGWWWKGSDGNFHLFSIDHWQSLCLATLQTIVCLPLSFGSETVTEGSNMQVLCEWWALCRSNKWSSAYVILGLLRCMGSMKAISHMITSSNGTIFRVTGHLCGGFTGLRRIPRTKASDAELW